MSLLFLGLTAILIGYFLVWLPGPSAGLQIIGIELGEWIKFLGVGARRDLFYLPPIVLGLTLSLLSAMWSNYRIQTWAVRVLAVGVSLLALPAVASMLTEPRREWLARVLLIGFVALLAGTSAILSQRKSNPKWIWLCIAVIGVAGAVLPFVQFLAIRPVVMNILVQPVSIGLGLWLNTAGALLVGLIAFLEFQSQA